VLQARSASFFRMRISTVARRHSAASVHLPLSGMVYILSRFFAWRLMEINKAGVVFDLIMRHVALRRPQRTTRRSQ